MKLQKSSLYSLKLTSITLILFIMEVGPLLQPGSGGETPYPTEEKPFFKMGNSMLPQAIGGMAAGIGIAGLLFTTPISFPIAMGLLIAGTTVFLLGTAAATYSANAQDKSKVRAFKQSFFVGATAAACGFAISLTWVYLIAANFAVLKVLGTHFTLSTLSASLTEIAKMIAGGTFLFCATGLSYITARSEADQLKRNKGASCSSTKIIDGAKGIFKPFFPPYSLLERVLSHFGQTSCIPKPTGFFNGIAEILAYRLSEQLQWCVVPVTEIKTDGEERGSFQTFLYKCQELENGMKATKNGLLSFQKCCLFNLLLGGLDGKLENFFVSRNANGEIEEVHCTDNGNFLLEYPPNHNNRREYFRYEKRYLWRWSLLAEQLIQNELINLFSEIKNLDTFLEDFKRDILALEEFKDNRSRQNSLEIALKNFQEHVQLITSIELTPDKTLRQIAKEALDLHRQSMQTTAQHSFSTTDVSLSASPLRQAVVV